MNEIEKINKAKKEYNLDDEDIKQILSILPKNLKFSCDFIHTVAKNSTEYAKETVSDDWHIDEWLEDYVDFERIGIDWLRKSKEKKYEDFIELKDKRVVRIDNYYWDKLLNELQGENND